MKFENLLNIYESILEMYISKEQRFHKSEWDCKYALYKFFIEVKYECNDYGEITKVRVPNEEEMEQFKYIDEQGNIYDLVGIISYRGIKLPIYIDDYGQCYFTLIDNVYYSMGSYNNYLGDVCDIYDYNLLEKTRLI